MKHHNIKHYKRLRRELTTMRNGIIRSFNDVNNRSFHPDSLKQAREVVKKDQSLLNHIDAVIRAVCDFLEDDDFKLPPIPKVRVKKYKPPKPTPKDANKAEFSYTVGG